MANDEILAELIDIVKNIGKVFHEEGISAGIDFDPNDGMIIIKHQNTKSSDVGCIINSNNKTISGIDTSKFWLPDYSNMQKANKKILRLVQEKGYSLSNIKYKKIKKKDV